VSITIASRTITRVQIIDDDPSARKAYGFKIADLKLKPVPRDGPLPNIDTLISSSREVAEVAILDHHLTKRRYATYNGADVAARLYRDNYPAVLCTRYEKANVDEIRPLRRFIPVLLTPDPENFDMDTLSAGLIRCFGEFDGEFVANRRPWRTLIRIDSYDADCAYVIVPAWDPQQTVRLRLEHIPESVRKRILAGQERFHAQVNVGAEQNEDLFFESWELE
jgi:hypothetical protein